MGLISAGINAVTGALGDQFLEAVEPVDMGEHTVFTTGVLQGKGNKRASGIISNGSVEDCYSCSHRAVVIKIFRVGRCQAYAAVGRVFSELVVFLRAQGKVVAVAVVWKLSLIHI